MAKDKDSKLICGVCKKVCESRQELKNHDQLHAALNKTYTCSKCTSVFTSAARLRNHMVTSHNNNPFICDHCGRGFALKEKLRVHIRSHTGEKVHACSECDKRFVTIRQLAQHKKSHMGPRPFKCNLCDAMFTSSGNLKVHLKRHLGVKEYACEVCGRQFTRRDGLQKHLSCYHGNEKPFECTICKKRYKGHLMQHFRTHLQEKPHACNQCDARFVQRSQLTVHLRIHTGEKPYECRECGRCFAHSTALKLHIRRHTGEKPFRCPICPASRFVQLPHLKKHMRCIHKSDKPYLCPRCREFYKKKAELDAHMETCRADENLPPGKCSNGTQTDPLPEFEEEELALELAAEMEDAIPFKYEEHTVEVPEEESGEEEDEEEEEVQEVEEPPTPSPPPPPKAKPPATRSSPSRVRTRTSPRSEVIFTPAPKPKPSSRKTRANPIVETRKSPPKESSPSKGSSSSKVTTPPKPKITLKLRKSRLNLRNELSAPLTSPPISPTARSTRATSKPSEEIEAPPAKVAKIRVASIEKLKPKPGRPVSKPENGVSSTVSSTPASPKGRGSYMSVEDMRKKVGKLLESISTPERLKALGFGTRAIDDVLHDSILGSGRKPCEEKVTRNERLRRNVAILLEWTIPNQFKAIRDQRSTEELLEELTS